MMVKKIIILLSLVLVIVAESARADRIKDLTSIAGVRENQLVGYGLVVGLNGTGDRSTQAPFTNQSFRSMLTELGVRIPRSVNFRLRNVAAVAISAKLPPFAKRGQTIDVTVSSIGNATSLRGGVLLLSSLKGIDGRVYAVAQGNLVVSGIGAQGADGSKLTVNVPSVGRIPNGATVEHVVPAEFVQRGMVTFLLHRADFTTAKRIVEAINSISPSVTAKALDAGTVAVNLDQLIPPEGKFKRFRKSDIIRVISELENLTLAPGDAAAKVVVNSRTGTVVIGQHVRVAPAVVSHGNLSVIITEQPVVSQPGPFSRRGKTVVVPQSQITVNQERSRAFLFAPGASLNDIVKAVNKVGAAPGDLTAILESLKSVGALRAKLIVI